MRARRVRGGRSVWGVFSGGCFLEGECPHEPVAGCRDNPSGFVPVQLVNFALVRPLACIIDKSMSHWIGTDVFPFGLIALTDAELGIPLIALPSRGSIV